MDIDETEPQLEAEAEPEPPKDASLSLGNIVPALGDLAIVTTHEVKDKESKQALLGTLYHVPPVF